MDEQNEILDYEPSFLTLDDPVVFDTVEERTANRYVVYVEEHPFVRGNEKWDKDGGCYFSVQNEAEAKRMGHRIAWDWGKLEDWGVAQKLDISFDDGSYPPYPVYAYKLYHVNTGCLVKDYVPPTDKEVEAGNYEPTRLTEKQLRTYLWEWTDTIQRACDWIMECPQCRSLVPGQDLYIWEHIAQIIEMPRSELFELNEADYLIFDKCWIKPLPFPKQREYYSSQLTNAEQDYCERVCARYRSRLDEIKNQPDLLPLDKAHVRIRFNKLDAMTTEGLMHIVQTYYVVYTGNDVF